MKTTTLLLAATAGVCLFALPSISLANGGGQAKLEGTKATHQDSRAKSTKHEVANPGCIGDWINEGELCCLEIRPNGTCTLFYDDPKLGRRDIKIQGTWTQQGRALTVHYEKEWWGSHGKTQTYYYVSKNRGGGKEQEMLKIKYDAKNLQVAFWKVKK